MLPYLWCDMPKTSKTITNSILLHNLIGYMEYFVG